MFMNKLHKKKPKRQDAARNERSESRMDVNETLRELNDTEESKCPGQCEQEAYASSMSEQSDHVERPMSSVSNSHLA